MPTPSPQVGMIGHAPQVVVRPTEKALYTDLWTRQEYRSVSPGEACVEEFLRQARPKKGASVIDLGCGTGRAGLLLAVLGGLDVTLLDFASNCLDDDIRAMLATQAHTLRFIEADLTKPLPVAAEYGFCVDTLEHIPLAQVDAVLDHCLRACQHVFFQIATGADACGALVGHALHLTQPALFFLGDRPASFTIPASALLSLPSLSGDGGRRCSKPVYFVGRSATSIG